MPGLMANPNESTTKDASTIQQTSKSEIQNMTVQTNNTAQGGPHIKSKLSTIKQSHLPLTTPASPNKGNE
jgi:hypothetical protein